MAAQTNTHKIVVVGAGYAGVAATKRILDRAPDAHVTVVNPRDVFVERVRLHQLVADTSGATHSLRELLHPASHPKVGTVDRIEPEQRQAILRDGTHLDYDHLVYAAGSHSRRDLIEGADTHGWSVAEYEDAERLRDKVNTLPAGSTVTVIGGGLTGIEIATEIAEQRTDLDVVMVTRDSIGGTLSDGARSKILRVLSELGITTVSHSSVSAVDEGKVVLTDGRHLETDCPIVTASFVAADLGRRSGLATDENDRLVTDAGLVSASSPDIVGAGDAMVVAGSALRMSCQAAIPLGTHAGESVLALMEGREPKPLSPKFVGQCLSLGRRNAVFQLSDRHDRIRPWSIGGRPGTLLKEQIVSSTLSVALNPHRKISYSWSGR